MDHNLQNKLSKLDWIIPDPGDAGAISPLNTGVCELVSVTGNETRTLAAPPQSGLWLTLCLKTDGATALVVTCATGLNVTANTTITFDTAGEFITLVSIASGANFRWRAFLCAPTGDTPALG